MSKKLLWVIVCLVSISGANADIPPALQTEWESALYVVMRRESSALQMDLAINYYEAALDHSPAAAKQALGVIQRYGEQGSLSAQYKADRAVTLVIESFLRFDSEQRSAVDTPDYVHYLMVQRDAALWILSWADRWMTAGKTQAAARTFSRLAEAYNPFRKVLSNADLYPFVQKATNGAWSDLMNQTTDGSEALHELQRFVLIAADGVDMTRERIRLYHFIREFAVADDRGDSEVRKDGTRDAPRAEPGIRSTRRPPSR